MKRYFGSEIEFGLHAESPEGHVISASSLEGELSQDAPDIAEWWQVMAPEIMQPLGVKINEVGFTSQGGRIYFDMHQNFEVATPEVSDVFELVKYEIASEELAFRSLKSMKDLGIIKDRFMLNKRSTDIDGHGWAYHENISVSRDGYPAGAERFMASHNVTRSVYAGAGGFLGRENPRYLMSPRLALTTKVADSERVRTKPIFCDRFDQDVGSWRMQQVGNESTSSPWAIAVRHGMNEVTAELVERGYRYEDLILEHPLKAGRIVNNDMSVSSAVRLERSGRSILPTEWQREVAVRGYELDLEQGNLSKGARWAINQVVEVTEILDDDPSLAADRVEWVARLEYLRGARVSLPDTMPKHEKQEHLLDRDFIWDSVYNGVAARKRREDGWGWSNMPEITRADIRKAAKHPPQDTRAVVRSAIVERSPERVHDWHKVFIEGLRSSRYDTLPIDETVNKY